jgi:ATP-dependent RNA helicase RhlE
MSFETFGLHPDLLRGVRDMGFTTPTPIQTEAIPPVLDGRDVLACAMTGSGKTAAFLLPILHRLLTASGNGNGNGTSAGNGNGSMRRGRAPGGRGPRVLVLSPTRELAAQIHEHLESLAKHTRLTGAPVFGGVGMNPQEQAFRRGVDFIVATPGRLLDHLQYDYASFDALEVLVLDEADRMLDMGFLPDIRRVLARLPKERQTLFFSATMPGPIVALSRDMLQAPATLNLQRKSAPATGIEQSVYPVPAPLKAPLFVELLRRGDVGQAIVFCRTKHRANRLADVLEKAHISSARIHGNRSQTARTEALAGFRSGSYRVLVATDIVARGIDVEALEHVVNFDVPHVPEDYIHRVGRTARAGATGDAITFVSPEEEQDLRGIERAVGRKLPRLTVPGFDYQARPAERFEVPIAERIAEIRKRKAEERARAREKAERKTQREAEEAARRGGRPAPAAGSMATAPAGYRREQGPAGSPGSPDAPRMRRGGGGRGGRGGAGGGGQRGGGRG